MTYSFDGNRNWAVALVHGVGTTESIPLIRDVTKAIKSARPDLELEPRTVAYEREGRPPQYERRGKIGNVDVRFATAHWSDITVLKQGFLNLMGGILLGGLGVRYFANVACSHNRRVARFIDFLLQAMIVIIALGVIPVTLVTLIMSMSALGASYIIPSFVSGATGDPELFKLERNADYYRAGYIVGVTFLTCLLIGVAGIWRVRALRRERSLGVWIFGSIIVVATFASLAFAATHGLCYFDIFDHKTLRNALITPITVTAEGFSNEIWSRRVQSLILPGAHIALMRWLQILLASVLILLTLGVLIGLALMFVFQLYERDIRRSIVFSVVSVVSMWVVFLFVFWPENLITAAAMLVNSDGTEWKNAAALSFKWHSLLSGEFVIIRFEDSPKGYFPLLWWEVVFLILVVSIALLFLWLAVLRHVWAAARGWLGPDRFGANDKKKYLKSSWPRFLISPTYKYMIITFMILICAISLLLLQFFDEEALEFFKVPQNVRDEIDNKLPHEFMVRSQYIKFGVFTAIILFLLVAHYIQHGLKLLLDVVNHFTAEREGFPIRRRIAERFDDCVEHLLQENDRPNLVIIAHSQGTVIALDALLAGLWEKNLKDRVSSLTVVTFGSPVTHIYQHYFKHLYPRFSETNLKQLQDDPRINWFNVYRVDDYIGTWIDHSVPGFPVNIPLKAGGHTKYWEPEVFQRLFEETKLNTFLMPSDPNTGTAPSV